MVRKKCVSCGLSLFQGKWHKSEYILYLQVHSNDVQHEKYGRDATGKKGTEQKILEEVKKYADDLEVRYVWVRDTAGTASVCGILEGRKKCT